MRNDYLFNLETIAVHSNFYQGHEYAGILQGKDYFYVNQSPLTIVSNSFLEAGRDLNGALKSSRYLLKKKCNVPIALSVNHNIILIQCKAASKLGGTVWIVSKHIIGIQPYNINQTLIHTTSGHTLIVDVKPEKLQTIRNLATILQTTLLEKQKMENGLTNDVQKKSGYMLIKEDGQINYTIKKKKKKWN